MVPGSDGSVRFAGSVTLGSMGRGRRSTLSLDRRRLAFFVLESIESAARDAAAEAKSTFAVTRLEAQLRRFFDDLYLRGALEGRTPEQAYYLHPSQSAPDAGTALRLGFALAEPGRFAEYSIELEGENPGRLLPLGAIEAAQLYS